MTRSNVEAGHPKPVDKHTATKFTWRDVCDGWSLATANELHVLLERMPPATYELRHVHDRTRQFYFVLEGQATFEVGATVGELPAGSGIEIAPGTPHQLRNDSTEALEFLVVSSGPPRSDRRDLAL